MTRRTRFIAGILTVLALTFSFAESVWASTCAPVMSGSDAAMAQPDAPPDVDCMGADTRQDEAPPGDDGRRCPFGSPATSQTCTGVASLPAQESPSIEPCSEGLTGAFVLDTRSDLLLENALFRPPRA